MKKIFVAIMAMAAFAACSNNEVISASQGDAIEFSNAFVGNSVRSIDPSITTNTLDNFLVYGTVTNTNNATANIFLAELVERSGAQWVYDADHTQYWVKGNTYNFYAVKNANTVNYDRNGVPTTLEYTADGVTDLLFDEELGLNYAGNVQPVKFDFRHLLSKVKFTVKNTMANGNGNSYKVLNVKINDAVKTAVYTVGDTWGSHATDNYNVEFGNIVAKNETAENADALKMLQGYEGASNYERLLVPQENAPLNITATVEYYVQNKMDLTQDVLVDTYTATVDATHTLEAGCAYNFVLELGNPGEPITFAVNKVEGWDQESVALNSTEVASADALAAAIASGNNIVLTQDITVAAPIAVAEGQNVIVDLGGQTLKTELTRASDRHAYAFNNYGTLTLVGDGVINARGIQNFGTMVIEGNVTITNIDTNGGAAIWNEGHLTVNNGTFATNADAGEGSYGVAINTRPGGVAVINNATCRAYSQLSYAIINEGTTTIYNADVKGKHGAVAGSETATTTIYGGTYELMENPAISDHCAYYVSAIYGGKFTLASNTDSGAQVFYESKIASGYKAVEENGWYTVVAE